MKYQIIEIGKEDAYYRCYKNRNVFIGQIGEANYIYDWEDGWFGVDKFVFDQPVIFKGHKKTQTTFHQVKLKLVD